MLTLNQIIEIYSEGIDIIVKNSKHSKEKGFYESRTIHIHPNNHSSKQDQQETIIHELLHARNELRRYTKKDLERLVAKEAKETLNRKPYLIKIINWLYNIKQ